MGKIQRFAVDLLYSRFVPDFDSPPVCSEACCMQASNATSWGTLAATKLVTALRSNAATALPSLTSLVGSFSLTGSQLTYTLGSFPLAAVACVTQQATFMFSIDFGGPQSDAAVQSAVQTAVASANSPLAVVASAVNVRSGVYNVTAVFPGNNQVSTDNISDTVCLCTIVDPSCALVASDINSAYMLDLCSATPCLTAHDIQRLPACLKFGQHYRKPASVRQCYLTWSV